MAPTAAVAEVLSITEVEVPTVVVAGAPTAAVAAMATAAVAVAPTAAAGATVGSLGYGQHQLQLVLVVADWDCGWPGCGRADCGQLWLLWLLLALVVASLGCHQLGVAASQGYGWQKLWPTLVIASHDYYRPS